LEAQTPIRESAWKRYPGLRAGLIVPTLEASRLEKASRCSGSVMHLELEDGVPPERKSEARATLRAALQGLDWGAKLTLVRVNPVTSGFLEDDVAEVIAARPTAFLLAKCQSAADIRHLDHLITEGELKHGLPSGSVKIATMVERVSAFRSLDELAVASERMMAFYLGPGDLGAEVGYRRTYQGREHQLDWYRSMVVCAAHAHGLLAIDSPTLHYHDLEETHDSAYWSYLLGFDAKTCISPRQLEAVNRAFTPGEREVEWAKQVFLQRDKAKEAGLSVWVQDGMMVDDAMLAKAHAILVAADAASA